MPLLEDAQKREAFERLIQQHVSELPEAVRDFCIYVDADKLKVSWPAWLQMYRDAFSDLEREIGLPIQNLVGEIALAELPAAIDLVK
jgi:hypothetical protein